MFEKLKKLIFDESDGLSPEEDLYEIQSDSLEENSNLIKTQPLKRSVREIEETEPVSIEPEVLLKRIDIEETKVIEEPKVIEKPVVRPVEKRVEPTKPVDRPKVKKKAKNPQYYKPRPVISPMFGVSHDDQQRNKQIHELTKPELPSDDDKIISPMYGVVTAEQEIVTKHTKPSPRKRKTPSVNISLEEMLNMPSNDELEFTLFDVKVDRDEFQSRENKLMNESKE